MARANRGIVYLIGAGPGDPELITVKGRRLLETCDAVIYDNLVANELVLSLPESAEKYYVGKKAGHHCYSQADINRLLVELAGKGKAVARLKGGDPFVFGRGAEEARHLKRRGIRFEIVSGVTSGVAALAYNGIPCTDRTKSSFVVFATGHKASGKKRSAVPWDWIARAKQGTIVVYMGMGELENIVKRLLDGGMPARTPAAVIERGTFPSQRVVTAGLGRLPEKARAAAIRPPAVIVIGEVVGLRPQLRWQQMRPLSGVRVMSTRLPGQAGRMHELLRESGAEVLSYPTIAVAEKDDPRGWAAFERLSGENRWLVFTSANGVRCFFRELMRRYGDIRRLSGFKIAVVGEGAARALKALNLATDFIPPKATVATLAGRMLKELDLSGAAVVRVRGTLAERTLERRLEKAGVSVTPLTVYRTRRPAWPEGLKGKLFDHPPQAMVFTSGSSVAGLFANLTNNEAKRLAAGAAVASIGPMTTKALRARGLKVTIEAEEHTVPGLVGAIVEHFRRRSRRGPRKRGPAR
ncbi:MAG: uroporphyrinogen-III C-methyltransferase [Elusimicrobiota bacterium]